MRLTDLIPGNKLELEVYGDTGEKITQIFVSEFEWADDENNAVIAAPIHEGIIYPVPIGATMEVFYAHKFDSLSKIQLYKFTACVRNRRVLDNIALLDIEIESRITRVQRRQFFRFECSKLVSYRQAVLDSNNQEEDVPFKSAYTVDVSGGGLCFVSDEEFGEHKILEMNIELKLGKTISFLGKIVRVDKRKKEDKYEVAVLFENIENRHREAIIKYIFLEQRKLRKKGLI